ncbi:hypothetical protein SOV_04960 [Sporomusa ovata DSM 2662]|nr:hypothetical protein SOV_2c10890 [Sporomusa ovata DSM 2662]
MEDKYGFLQAIKKKPSAWFALADGNDLEQYK